MLCQGSPEKAHKVRVSNRYDPKGGKAKAGQATKEFKKALTHSTATPEAVLEQCSKDWLQQGSKKVMQGNYRGNNFRIWTCEFLAVL
jgi:hypothetical protein